MADTATAPKRSSEWACGPALEAAAAFVQSIRTASSPTARLRAVTDRDALPAVRRLFRELPELSVPFSDSVEGREMLTWFRPERRLPFNRAPIAVLELPGTQAEYLRGRPRQALRTNLTKARAEGLVCSPIETARQVREVATAVLTHRNATADTVIGPGQLPGPDRLWSATYDAAGNPVAVVQAAVDDSVAGLIAMVTATGHPAALLARYALQTQLVERLIDREVTTYVVGGSMLLTSTGTRYFQHRTGFTPVHLKAVRVPGRQSVHALAA